MPHQSVAARLARILFVTLVPLGLLVLALLGAQTPTAAEPPAAADVSLRLANEASYAENRLLSGLGAPTRPTTLTSPGLVWVGTHNAGVWLYNARTGEWTECNNGLPSTSLGQKLEIADLAVNPFDDNVLLAIADDLGATTPPTNAGVYLTQNAGMSWAKMPMPAYPKRVGWRQVRWDPTTPGKVIASGMDAITASSAVTDRYPAVAGSMNYGRSWFKIDMPKIITSTPLDGIALWGSGPYWYIGAGGGGSDRQLYWSSSNGGISWATRWNDALFSSGQAARLAGRDEAPAHVYMARGDGGSGGRLTISQDGGATWAAGAAFTTSGLGELVYDPTRPNTLWLAAYQGDVGTFRSQDDGQTFTPTLSDVRSAVAVDGYTGRVYAGGQAERRFLRYSDDGGLNWIKTITAPYSESYWPTVLAIPQPPPLPSDGVCYSCLTSYSNAVQQVGGPINTQDGSYRYRQDLLSIPERGGALDIDIFYNSLNGHMNGLLWGVSGRLGYGWRHSYDIQVECEDATCHEVKILMPDGALLRFAKQLDGTYHPYPGVRATLHKRHPGWDEYILTTSQQTVYYFNWYRQVSMIRTPSGGTFHFDYDHYHLSRVTGTGGQWLEFEYTGAYLTSISDPMGRTVQFDYDADGDLSVMTDTASAKWVYTYITATLPRMIEFPNHIYTYTTVHLLTQIEDPTGRTVERTEFDEDGRAVRQWAGDPSAGSGQALSLEIGYNLDGTRTITRPLPAGGSVTSTARYDARGTVVELRDTAGAVERVYDVNFYPRWTQDKRGNPTAMTWDARGNLTQTVDALGYTTTMEYDGLNNLRAITDARGFTTSYVYSGTLLTRMTDALGRTTIYTYSAGLLTAQRDAGGKITRYEYNDFGQRTVITDPARLVTRYEYDPVGRLITATAPGGQVTVNEYDNADRLVRVTRNYTTAGGANYLNEYNLITRYKYDGAGRQVAVTDTLGHVSRSEYDEAGRLIKSIQNYAPGQAQNYLNQYNITTGYGYDNSGNQAWVTDTLGHVTRTDYDALGRPATVTVNYVPSGPFDADTNITRTTGYDPNGNVVTRTDTLGRKTVTQYDALNRPVTVTANYVDGVYDPAYPDQDLTTLTVYDEAGNALQQRDAGGHWTYYEYDELGRLITTTNALAGATVTVYNAAGQRSKTRDAGGAWTQYGYDDAGRLVTVTANYQNGVYDPALPDQDIVAVTVYDDLGRRVKSIEAFDAPVSRTTVYTYSPTGRLIATADPDGAATRYSYDAMGRTLLVTDALGHATHTAYDALGRAVTTTANYAPGGPVDAQTNVATANRYNALGWRTAAQDARGYWATFGHDDLGRVITTTDATGRGTVTAYDRAGNRVRTSIQMSQKILQARYEYDGVNRLIAQSDALNHATRYGYDAAGNRVVMTDANGVITRYGYDPLSRLIAVTENYTSGSPTADRNVLTTYAYDALGNRVAITNALGRTTVYTYDALSRLVATSDPLSHTTRYGYDALSNRVVMTDANGVTTHYTYNPLGRLLVSQSPGHLVTYAYDQLGNRAAMTDATGTTTYMYDALYRPLTITSPYSGAVGYGYDAAGNRTQLIYPDPSAGSGRVVTYTYDDANRLIGLTDWSDQSTTYEYDAWGRLAETTLPNCVQTLYTYDTANRLTRLTQRRVDGELLGDYGFVLDAVGNRIRVTETLQQAAGAAGGQASALPTDAAELIAAVTGHRPMGLSSPMAAGAAFPLPAPTLQMTTALTTTIPLTLTPPGVPTDTSALMLAGIQTGTGALTSTGWWAGVQEAIRQSEYNITWQEGTFLPDLPQAYQAPNRAHNLRTYFTSTGIRIIPRAEITPTWETRLALTGYGRAGHIQAVEASTRKAAIGHRFEYHYQRVLGNRRLALAEWYVNDERGLEQGFTLETPPLPPSQGPLVLEMTLGGSLTPTLTSDESAVELLTAGGVRVLRYSDLSARDASGQALPAHIELTTSTIRLVVDDTGAAYPIAVDPLLTVPSWSVQGDQAGAQLGFSVSTAGDVDGDGYSDILIGAPLYDSGWADAGKVFLYHGSASGVDSKRIWTAGGDQGMAQFGYSVGTAGDVNGDGYADIIIGEPYYGNEAPFIDRGRVFVWYSPIEDENSDPDWMVEGNQGGALLGFSVGTAGDVDRNGYSDLVIGAPGYNSDGKTDNGKVYVYRRTASGTIGSPWTAVGGQSGAKLGYSVGTAGDVDGDGYSDVMIGAPYYDGGAADDGRAYVYRGYSSGLLPEPWMAQGEGANNYFGYSASAAGDVNGDGYADVIIGAYGYTSAGSPETGRAYVYHGSAGGARENADQTLTGSPGSRFGYSVSAAGDVNGDGYADVMVGAPLYDGGQTDEGRAYVFHGSSSGANASADWAVESDQAGVRFGQAVNAAGDVDGDGYADVIVGAPLSSGKQGETEWDDAGRAYVYHGSPASLNTAAEWTAQGGASGDYLGNSLGTAGDVNGDGYADVIVSAHYYDGGYTNEGKVWVYYGAASGPDTYWTAQGGQENAYFGYSAGAAGDVNGDGYADVIVGAHGHDGAQADTGKVYIYYGSAQGLSSAGWTVEGDQGGAYFGYPVSSAGDVNGDGYADVLVGAHRYDSGQTDEGKVFVYYGRPCGPGATADWSAESDAANVYFGWALGTAGDVNRDGYADIVVGTYNYSNGQTREGRAWVYYGSADGLRKDNVWTAEINVAYAYFGNAVSTAGDVNGDGYSDVVIGAYGGTYGKVYVYYGSASGMPSSANWIQTGGQSGAQFGVSVSTAGDVNGDGYADVMIGSNRYTNGEYREGRVFVYHGSASGLAASAAWWAESDQANANMGLVRNAGDVNGDGYADVMVGAHLYDNGGQADSGKAFLYYGNAGRGLVMRPRQVRTNSTAPVAPLGKSDSDDGVQLGLTARTPLGRDKVKLQWQIAPLGTPFPATPGVSGAESGWTDALPGTVITRNVAGLEPGTSYHWRVRLLYRPNRLGQTASRWIHIPWNGWQETDFRTLPPTLVRTITYTYDPLYRLIQANYSTGEVFEYTYNKLGNRMRYTQTITTPVVTVYIYDAANRLTSVNGQTYTWDNNGNLLNDGSKGYTYDAANRLTGITATGLTWSAAYNGDGARIKQTINGVKTKYLLDLAAPLVTVLAEKQTTGNQTYLYGLGDSPLASYDGAWRYLSGRDGLNSVRQETDAAGNVIAARSFDPYGVPLGEDGGSPFGFTGEMHDEATGLVFLRARYYNSQIGRFLNRDMWGGNVGRPNTLHGYAYAANNPILYSDPSGVDYIPALERYTCNDSHALGGYVYHYSWAAGRWGNWPCVVNSAGYTVVPEASPFYPDPHLGFGVPTGPLPPPPPLLLPPSPIPTPVPPILDVPWADEMTQDMRRTYPNSCGLLALYMFLQGEQKPVDLSTLAQQLRGERPGGYDGYCCRYDPNTWTGVPAPTPDPLGWCNQACVSAEALAAVARKYYGMAIESGDNWTRTRVHQKLLDGHPVIALVRVNLAASPPRRFFGGGGFGHFVVIRGLINQEETVVFNDSYPASEGWNWTAEQRRAVGEGRQEDWAKFDSSWASAVDQGDDPMSPEGHVRWAMAVR